MFTVVIAQQEHIDNIKKYELFLKPFIDPKRVAFCAWNTEGKTFKAMVPDLIRLVERRSHWRAFVICDEEGMAQTNPFDIVKFKEPEQSANEPGETFFERCFKEKCEAYDQAAEKPLVRLMTYLCQFPQVETDKDFLMKQALRQMANAVDAQDQVAYQADYYESMASDCYHKTAAYKQKLRKKILNGASIGISYPQEIYCIAKRTLQDSHYALNTAWTEHVDHQYSRFYEWNMYFDKMRYLLIDVIEKNQQNYTYDYLRFLYSVMLLASNEIPKGSIRPFRVYSLDCENDETALSRLMLSYERKLNHTEDEIRGKIERDLMEGGQPLSDKEVDAFFSASITVAMPAQSGEEQDGFFVDKKKIGLASDKPQHEKSFWLTCRQRAVETLHKMLKMPQRNLAVAVDNMHQMDEMSMEHIKQLNKFQISDVKEHIDRIESEMISSCPPSINDASFFEKKMKEYAKPVQEEIDRRMSHRTICLVGGLILLTFFLCYVPLFLENFFAGIGNMAAIIGLVAGSVALLACVGFVCLLVFRGKLRGKIVNYNRSLDTIWRQIYGISQAYSRYLSCACNVMRGNRVLNYYYENEDENILKQRVLEKHICDIEKAKAELIQIFGMYINGEVAPDPMLTDPYDYDFTRTVEYKYPVPYMDCTEKRVRFIQCGSYVTAPVDFVTGLTAAVEELYD